MKFTAHINIMPLKTLLDPQGKAVSASMRNIGISEIKNVRIGKHITLEINAKNKEEASKLVTQACSKLLVNQIMESFDFSITKI